MQKHGISHVPEFIQRKRSKERSDFYIEVGKFSYTVYSNVFTRLPSCEGLATYRLYRGEFLVADKNLVISY